MVAALQPSCFVFINTIASSEKMGYIKTLKTRLRGHDGGVVAAKNDKGELVKSSSMAHSERKMKAAKDTNLVEIPKVKGDYGQTSYSLMMQMKEDLLT